MLALHELSMVPDNLDVNFDNCKILVKIIFADGMS